MCLSVGVRESTNVSLSGSECSRRMCLSGGVRESTNVSLSGSEGVNECVSQWE